MVYYRKYRPQNISELDSLDVREKLTAALSGKSISHAFLFTGPKGLGKTSAARIVAKAVNCEKLKVQSSKLKVVEPCNRCNQCVSITNGTNLDVLEIDGASNRGIDEIRDLREKIRLSPLSASKKVYIIDEVHMLTQEAFNALLKTLEEPPAHALFILCTTEMHKVPLTIISRCFQIVFKKATQAELINSMKRIVKGEKLLADKEALLAIAKLSDGGFREAAKLLEEISLLAAGKKITEELIEKKYRVSSIKHQVEEMIEALEKRDVKKGLRIAGELSGQGTDMKYFTEELVGSLHVLLLSKVGIESGELKVLASRRSGQSSRLTMEDARKLIELFSKAHGELKYAVLPELPLELAVIEWGMLKLPSEDIVRGSALPEASADLRPSSEDLRPASLATLLSSTNKNDKIWQELIEKVKSKNHSIAGVLRGCKLASLDKKKMIIETKYTFHKDRLEDKKVISLLQDVYKDISGKDVILSIVLKN